MAISSPPIVSPCYYGIDTPKSQELIAATHSLDAVRRFLGVDSLHYLSVAGMLRAAGGGSGKDYCAACFTGNYPTHVADYADSPLRGERQSALPDRDDDLSPAAMGRNR